MADPTENPRPTPTEEKPREEAPTIAEAMADVAVSLARLGAAVLQLPIALLPKEQRVEAQESARDIAKAASYMARTAGDAIDTVVEDLGRNRESGHAREDLGSRLRREEREARRQARREAREARRQAREAGMPPGEDDEDEPDTV